MCNPKENNKQEPTELESLKSVYDICIKTRNFEITQLIQRNNFFMLFQGVLLAAALQNQTNKPFVEFVICLSGVFVSFYQMQMASGAKYWQEWWETRLEDYEKKLKEKMASQTFYELFTTTEQATFEAVSKNISKPKKLSITNYLILKNFSVGRTPIKVSIVLLLTWTALLTHTINIPINTPTIITGFKFAPPPNSQANSEDEKNQEQGKGSDTNKKAGKDHDLTTVDSQKIAFPQVDRKHHSIAEHPSPRRLRAPCGAPSNAGGPGDFGEDCLRPAGPSSAAARPGE